MLFSPTSVGNLIRIFWECLGRVCVSQLCGFWAWHSSALINPRERVFSRLLCLTEQRHQVATFTPIINSVEQISFISLTVGAASWLLLHFFLWAKAEQGGTEGLWNFIAFSIPLRNAPTPFLLPTLTHYSSQLILNSLLVQPLRFLQNFYWHKLLKPNLAVIFFSPMEKNALQEQQTLYNLGDPGAWLHYRVRVP